MSNQSDIATANKGLFALHVLAEHVQDSHRQKAKKIKEHFNSSKRHNPYKISQEKLRNLSEADTENYYIKPVLDALGYIFRKDHRDTNNKFPDFWLLNEEPEKVSAEFLQRANVSVLEAKAYSVDLDIGDGRKERPSEQITRYIRQNMIFNQYKRWGILSNGFKWRIYSAISRDRFIEFDLDLALESEDELARFCLLFEPEAFLIRESRSCSLDNIMKASLASWEKFSQLIEDRANAILLELINALVEEGDSLDGAKIRSYDILYKLLFSLYSESKRLLPINIAECGIGSLRQILFDMQVVVFEEYEISSRITALFNLYKYGNSNLPKNFGGEHFASNTVLKVKNKFLINALELLTVFNRDGGEVRFFDFSSLNVELIGDVYESTLKAVFKEEDGKIIQETKKGKTGTDAHSSGTTYTPNDVVQYLVGEAFKSSEDFSSKIPTVYDPACGSGHFLVEACRVLAKKIDVKVTGTDNFIDHLREIVVRCIYGNDKNELASMLCRLMLAIETAKRGVPVVDLKSNIRSFDSLFVSVGDKRWCEEFCHRVDHGFDFVIGNPPYVRADEPGQEKYRDSIKSSNRYRWLHKKWDLFIPFVEMGTKLVEKTNGVLAYVVGNSITYAPYSERCVKALSDSKKIRFVSHFNKPFNGWAFPATCFVYDMAHNGLSDRRMHEGNNPMIVVESQKVTNAFLSPGKATTISGREGWDGLVLGDIAYISVGMVLNSHEKLKPPGGPFKKGHLLFESPKPDQTHPVQILENDDIQNGKIVLRKPCFIEYGPGLRAPRFIRRPTFSELHEGERVLLSRSYLGRSVAKIERVAIVSDSTIVLKRWADLHSIENKSINKKIRKAQQRFPGIQQSQLRSRLEAISNEISLDLIVGILGSRYFIEWVNSDRRHKHCIVPDVVSEMPLPFKLKNVNSRISPSDVNFARNKVKVDSLSFSREVSRISSTDPCSNENISLIINYIEEIVQKISDPSVGSTELMLTGYLDALVELLFIPIRSTEYVAA